MRRQNAIEIEVMSPTVGLSTRMPSNQPERSTGRAMTEAVNVRFEDGVVSTAPGMEEIGICPAGALDGLGQINFLQQSNITSGVALIQRDAPILGFTNKLFRLDRRFGAECLVSDTPEPTIQWFLDTTPLTTLPEGIIAAGIEVHAYLSGDPDTAASTILLSEYVAYDDFVPGDTIDITSDVLNPAVTLIGGVYRVYFIFIAGSSGGPGNGPTTVTVPTLGYTGTVGQGVMLDATYTPSQLGGYTQFLDKSTGFTVIIDTDY